MRQLFLSLLLICNIAFAGTNGKQLQTLCSEDFLQKHLVQPQAFAPVPKYLDLAWRKVPADMRKALAERGRSLLNYQWKPIDLELFAEYKSNGNRTHYEDKFMQKRNNLVTLAFAELMDAKGAYLPQIEAGLQSLLDEPWWGLPAHYPLDHPDYDVQTVALFSAETAALMSWMAYIYGDALNPDLVVKIKKEVKYRLIDQCLDRVDNWRTLKNNWNPWICSNWLTCVLFVEPDRDTQIKSVSEVLKSLDIFIDGYPKDGGCDEGPSYFDRAAGSLLDCLVLLDLASDHNISISDNPKIHAMAEYICNLNIDNKHCVNFADGLPTLSVLPVWHIGAALIGNDNLMSLTASAADKFSRSPAKILNYVNPYTLGRQLLTLNEIRTSPDNKLAASASGQVSLPFDAWYPNIQVIAARSFPNSTDGLFFAAKGGNNGESHNHNDIGNVIVYNSGKPILIDLGRFTYTSDSFNENRYKAMNTQSGYHNVPVINSFEQHDRAIYQARNVDAKIKDDVVTFSLDLAGAYPEDAKIKSWVRTIELHRNQSPQNYITITEDYKLSKFVQAPKLTYLTPIKPVLNGGSVTLGNVLISYDPKKVCVTYESVPIEDSYGRSSWGRLIYRLQFSPLSKKKSNKITLLLTQKTND